MRSETITNQDINSQKSGDAINKQQNNQLKWEQFSPNAPLFKNLENITNIIGVLLTKEIKKTEKQMKILRKLRDAQQ